MCGHPGPALNAWIESPHVNDVMYFGSSNLGMKFERRCVEAGKKPILELAGNELTDYYTVRNEPQDRQFLTGLNSPSWREWAEKAAVVRRARLRSGAARSPPLECGA